ncbi:hypothetical protein [Streptomyces sp. G45]|uniref:hypothetical protein n=1 Tax=Streptomyces sp. G45 TaxID=3406627 RepID=UPI003C140061
MDPEVTALAAAGATALVQAMVGDGWTHARDRVAAFLGRRRDGGEDGLAGELDEARAELTASRDATVEEGLRVEWRNRMRRALRDDPEAARELRALLAELGYEGEGGARGGAAHNTISGGVQHGGVIQAHTVGDVHLG